VKRYQTVQHCLSASKIYLGTTILGINNKVKVIGFAGIVPYRTRIEFTAQLDLIISKMKVSPAIEVALNTARDRVKFTSAIPPYEINRLKIRGDDETLTDMYTLQCIADHREAITLIIQRLLSSGQMDSFGTLLPFADVEQSDIGQFIAYQNMISKPRHHGIIVVVGLQFKGWTHEMEHAGKKTNLLEILNNSKKIQTFQFCQSSMDAGRFVITLEPADRDTVITTSRQSSK
jgi:hypothetical protein